MRYKIKLINYDYGDPMNPHDDSPSEIYENRNIAHLVILEMARDLVRYLNDDENISFKTMEDDSLRYRVDLDGDAEAIVRYWYENNEDYCVISIYTIEEVE